MRKQKVSLDVVFLVALLVSVVSHAADVRPFKFSTVGEDPAVQQEEWDRLIKYKLFATGDLAHNDGGDKYGINFKGQNIYITDTIGYVGSAKGNLYFTGNINHNLGGAILFGGSYSNQDGYDTLLTGPIRFLGNFQTGFNSRGRDVYNGNVCIGGHVNTFSVEAITNPRAGRAVVGSLLDAGGCDVTNTVGGSNEYDNLCNTYTENLNPALCNDTNVVPLVDLNLEVPGVDTSVTYRPAIDARGTVAYIDVPEEGTATDICAVTGVCDIFIESISLGNNAKLIVRMPANGRLTRIFLNGSLSFDATPNLNIEVMHVSAATHWNVSTKTWGEELVYEYADDGITVVKSNTVSNKDYAGNLLIYTPYDINLSAAQKNLQGTYITASKFIVEQNTTFAGQILARYIQFNAEFRAKDFRYVPFDPPGVEAELGKNLYEGKNSVDTISIVLDKIPSTAVSYKYCFKFYGNAEEGKAEGNYDASLADVNLSTYNIPICAADGSVYGVANYKKGSIYPDKPILLQIEDDKIQEENETFEIHFMDLEGAVIKSGGILVKGNGVAPISIIDDDLGPLSVDDTIAGFEDTPFSFTGIYAFKAYGDVLLKDLASYSIIIESLPAKGSLKFNGNLVKVGDSIASSQMNLLVFQSLPDDIGNPYTTFKFSVYDPSAKATSDSIYTRTIVINNLNDAPTIADLGVLNIKENNNVGDSVVTVVAKDIDNDPNLVFTMVTAQDDFAIDPVTGQITALKSFNHEVKALYVFDIMVTDSEGLSDTATVTIKVLDVNELDGLRDTTLYVSENQPRGTLVGVVPVYDEDTAKVFRKYSFSILSGDTSKFAVALSSDGAGGAITTKTPLDFEADSMYVLKLKVVNSDLDDGNVVTIIVKNIYEEPVIVVETGTGEDGKVWEFVTDTIFVNENTITITWNADNIRQPDTTLTGLHEGYNVVELNYYDETKDVPGTKIIWIFVCTRTPRVEVSTDAGNNDAGNIYTIVEERAEGDTAVYVNKKNNVIDVSITTPVIDDYYTDSTFHEKKIEETISATLDTIKGLANNSSLSKTIASVADAGLKLNVVPGSGATRNPYNDSLRLVTYLDTANGVPVKVSFVADLKGDVVKNKDGEEVMTISFETTLDGKTVVVSMDVDASTGKLLKNEFGSPYSVSYTYKDKNGKEILIAYPVSDKLSVLKDKEGNISYKLTYTYENEFGNSASRSLVIVYDIVAPKVEILTPVKDQVIRANFTNVEWTVDLKDGKGPVVQDTLVMQGLEKGPNAIVRMYKDKAGNVDTAIVYVVMKNAKDVEISVETPVTIVTDNRVDEYYSVNEPEDGEEYAVTLYNPNTDKEEEVLTSVKGKKHDGKGNEPYPGLEGHLGPTLIIDVKAPIVSGIAGLATLDDLLSSDGSVSLDGVDASNSAKMPVEEYVKEYCSDEFQKDLSSDYTRANLYDTKLNVKIWVYTTLGNFVDYFSFSQELNNPDYVTKAGMLQMYFEQKPDKNGDVRDASGRLYATGSYVYKTEVSMKAKLRCTLPPVKDDAKKDQKMGAVRKASEDLLKPFGYKRPKK
ncbi:MAG: cadherin repeat domain-containing protein [Fibrobacteraceae bacterium]|nr:cadherin repeat domain-containing protein [Fibrobacteraceae bacterium]